MTIANPTELRRRWKPIALCVVVVVALAILLLLPPADTVHKMYASPRFNKFQRYVVLSQAPDWGKIRLSFLPKTISFQSSGPPVRMYLLNLNPLASSRERVEAMLKASSEIEQGRDPDPAYTMAKAVNVQADSFRIHWWPWGQADYMLIMASDQEVEVTVRIAYGW